MAQDRMNMTVPGRKYRRKKRITRTPPSLKVAKLQSQVRKISKTLKQNVEVKNNDSSFPNTAIDWNGLLTTPIFAPTVGDTRSTRTGAQVSITGGEIRYRVSSSAVAAASIRVLLVIDKEGTGTALSEYFDTAEYLEHPLLHSRFSTETGVQISRLFTTSYMNLIIKQAIFSNMRRLKSQRCRYSSTMLVPQFVRTL